MSYVIYAYLSVTLVLVIGWSIYVLPTPGDYTAWELAGALAPAFILLFGAVAILAIGKAMLFLAEMAWRAIRRKQPR